MARVLADTGKDWPQILAITVACIPGLTSAIICTWTAPFILVLSHDKKSYDISEDEANIIPVLAPLGLMVTALFFYNLPDKIGPKRTLLLLSIPHALFWIITIFAKDIYSFCIARVLGGITDAVLYAVLPIYIGEVTTPRIRGTWGNGQSFSFNAGFFLINAVGSYLTIQQTAYIFITLPIISAVLFFWMPESPYYYLTKGQDENARKSLEWLLRKDNIDNDFQQLKADVKRQISETGTWKDLFGIRSNRKALTACIFIRWGQQLSGISVVENYFQYIIQKSGSEALSPQMSSIVFSVLLWLVMTAFSVTADKLGRRKSYMYSALSSSLILLAESIFFYLDEYRKDIDLSDLQWFPIAGFVIYVFCYSGGLGMLPSLMAGELFSASVKGKALSISNVAMGMIVFISTSLFTLLNSLIGLYAPFLFFSVFTFLSFVISYYIVPETKGKTLEEIQQGLKKNCHHGS